MPLFLNFLYHIEFFLNASRHFTDNASVNVAKIKKHYIALTETPCRVEFDPDNLNTLGQFLYDDKITGHLTTVHPQFDYAKNELYNYITKFSLTSTYNIYKIKQGTKKREILASIPVKKPSYMHSFSITKNHIVLTEFPLFINPFKLLLKGSCLIDNLSWEPQQGTRFLVIDKNTGKLVNVMKSPAFFAFHHINCFEEKKHILVDITSYKDSSIINSIYLNNLREGNFLLPTPKVQRYHLDLTNNKVTPSTLSQNCIEFPRINYEKCNGKNYNYIYGLDSHNSNGFVDKLIKFCIKSDSYKYWYEENLFPGEPVFISAPNASKEDDGVVLSLVLDTIKHITYLLILDATSFCEIGRAYLPFAVPFGSHGQYFDS